VEVCPIQLPGRENRIQEPSGETYEELGAAVAEAIAPYLDRPFGLFGHCASAYIALETAAQLQNARARPPAALFISAMVPPERAGQVSVLQLGAAELEPFVAELLKSRGVDVFPELLEIAVDMIRTDLNTYQRYSPLPSARLVSPIELIGWRDDIWVPPAELAGWDTIGNVRQHILPGGHWTFLSSPRELFGVIERCLHQPITAQQL
jgi:surfactin synthase thioesterase subunit